MSDFGHRQRQRFKGSTLAFPLAFTNILDIPVNWYQKVQILRRKRLKYLATYPDFFKRMTLQKRT